MKSVRLFLFISILLVFNSPIITTNPVETYFIWIRMTFWKTVSLIPSDTYMDTDKICRRSDGNLLTFSPRELDDLVHQLKLTYGTGQFWIGMTKEPDGRVYWSDSSPVSKQFRFSQDTSVAQRGFDRQCGFLNILRDQSATQQTSTYELGFGPCNHDKKAICEEGYNRIWNPNKIIAVTALAVSTLCLFLMLAVVLKWCCCRAHDNYIMRSKRNGSSIHNSPRTAAKNVTQI